MMFPGAPVAVVGLLLLAGCSADAGHPAPPAAAPVAPEAPGAQAPDVRVAPTDPELVDYPIAVPPARLEVAAVGIDMDVVPVGRHSDGWMELPERVDVAGWYRLSASPQSSGGNTVIAAHVDSLEYGLGPFVGLKDLENGAVVEIVTAEGETERYEVTSVQKYSKNELPVDSIFSRDGEHGLVLITCGGEFDRESRRYSDNVVVTATPMET